MKVIVKIKRNPEQIFLVDLPNDRLIHEVKKLITKNKHSKAIATALCKGRFEKELFDDEVHITDAAIILSEDNVSWSL
ncbi:MAG: hypothetical protein WCV56_05810 [Candidatus Omnitrophota bacterium]|nr:hypothetical protein [Parabacteroides sp.]